MKVPAALKRLARLPRALLLRLAASWPGSSIQFGPPRRSADSREASSFDGRCHQLFPARSTVRPAAVLADPPLDKLMGQATAASIKSVYVAEIPHGRYWGRFYGNIIDGQDTLLTDLSPTFAAEGETHDAMLQFKLPPLRELRGTAAVIHTLYANNFHHWLLDTVPRFGWLERAGLPLGEIDHFIFPKRLAPFHLQTMALLKIDPAKVILTHAHLHVRAERLLVPSASEPGPDHWRYDYTPEGLRFVRDLFLRGNAFAGRDFPKRLLISRERADARRFIQGARALELLAPLGFEKILLENFTLPEQAALFNQAECVIMPTGGNLANFVFCRPGTVAIELFGPNYTPNFSHAFLAEIGLRYYALVADKISRRYPEARLGNEDIDFDPERLAGIVRDALGK
jgi:capsular polysaccharide biosynthesis protein